MLRLTARGRDTYAALLPILREREARLLACLDPAQRAALDALLLALEASLGLMHCGPDGVREASPAG